MDKYPKIIKATDVANTIFGPGLFRIKGGRALYDEVYLKDGGNALYLARLYPDLTVSFRWIQWDSILEQMYDPLAPKEKKHATK